MLRKEAWILIIVALVGLGAWRVPSDPDPSAEAAARPQFPGFNLETFDGELLTQEELKGKVTLVTFWASWCPACRAELPLLDSLSRAVDHPDLVVIGINEDRNEAPARFLAEHMGLEMTQLLGRGHQQARYGYWGLPYTVLLDREGRMVETWYGYPGRRGFDEKIGGLVLQELKEDLE